MSALLAADTVAGLDHILVNVLVSDLGLVIIDTDLVESLVQTEVGHYGSNDLVVEELASLFHIKSVDVQDVVSGDHIALLVYTQTSVSISVICEAYIKSVINNEFLQMLDVSRTAVGIDIIAVRFIVDDINLGSERVENAFCDLPCSAVGNVKTYLGILEAVLGH